MHSVCRACSPFKSPMDQLFFTQVISDLGCLCNCTKLFQRQQIYLEWSAKMRQAYRSSAASVSLVISSYFSARWLDLNSMPYGGSVTTASTLPSVGRISRQSPK